MDQTIKVINSNAKEFTKSKMIPVIDRNKPDVNKPQLICFLLCENILADISNKISLINIFDGLAISAFPALIPVNIFFSFVAPKGEHNIVVTIETPSKKIINPPVTKINLNTRSTYNLRLNLKIGFEEKGSYILKGIVDNLPIAEKLLTVSQDN